MSDVVAIVYDDEGCPQLSTVDLELAAMIEASVEDITSATVSHQVAHAIARTEHDVACHAKKARKEEPVKTEHAEIQSSPAPSSIAEALESPAEVPSSAVIMAKTEIKPEVKPEGESHTERRWGGVAAGGEGELRNGNGVGGGVERVDVSEDNLGNFPRDILQPPPLHRRLSESLQQIILDIQSDDIRVLALLGFKTVLKPHQKEAVVFALHRANCDMGTLILDSMGLGKTVETLAIICCIRAWQKSSLPFLVCVPKGLVDQWTEEIMTHTTLAQSGDGITPYVDMDRHSLNPDYASIATSSVILTTRHIILSDMKYVYNKAHERFSSALFPGLSEYDAACVLVSGNGKLRNEIADRYPDIGHPGHSFYRSFHEGTWARSSDQWPKRFAALVIDEAHQLRNASAPTTRAMYALSKSTSFRYLLTGTPFNNGISDVATLSWLLQDGGAWQDPSWWRQMEGEDSDGSSRLESESVQANLRAWRASLLIRGKDRIRLELPTRTEINVPVQATGAEKKYSAALFIKFQCAIMEHDKAARQERNRFLAWSHILTTLLRMMQMTTHRLISTKNSRDFTHHYSRLSNYKHRPVCVNCEHFPDDIPLVQGASAVREFQAEDWLVNNGDSDGDGDSDEQNAVARSRRAAATNRANPLPCGHNVCSSCMQQFRADPVLFPCQFCVDMREIGMEMDPHYSSLPPPSSKLTMLVHELKTLSQYRAQAPKSETKVEAEEELPKKEAPQKETVQKAVVFTLFKATLDLCEALLRDAGITHVRIDGEMKVADRSRAVATFMHDESVHVLLASSRSAGLGLNLCRATTVIFLDRWWNPALEDQCADRIHRIGQTFPCTIKHLQVDSSMDTALLMIQEMKRKNGVLTLHGVGVFQGSMGNLNIDDVKCIRNALVKVYLPIIEADPELRAQYNNALQSLRSINERMDRERGPADADQNPQHPAAGAGNMPFGVALDNMPAGALRAVAAAQQLQHQPPQ